MSNNMNEDDFKNHVKSIFDKYGIRYRDIVLEDKKPLTLNQNSFFDLDRNRQPTDLFIVNFNITCELKSSRDLYKSGRFSKAHLQSYLFQSVYGQCFYYSDKYRLNGHYKIWLVLAKSFFLKNNSEEFIEPFLLNCVKDEAKAIYTNIMGLSDVTFSNPLPNISTASNEFVKLADTPDVILTEIEYHFF